LRDFYLPGRDRNRIVEWLGGGVLLAVFGGVLAHGAARVVVRRKRGRR
jgi:hypothetical protein